MKSAFEPSVYRSFGEETFGSEEPVFRSIDTSSGFGSLNPIPEFYDKYTSTVSSKDPNTVFSSLAAFLEDHTDCDYLPRPENAQIQGLLTDQGRVCLFTLSLYDCSGVYNDTGKSGVLVECSRKSGCSIAFNGFYRKVSGLFETRRRGLLRGPPAFAMNESEEELNISGADTSFLQSLVSMAGSKYYEARKDGLATLSYVSEDILNKDYLTGSSTIASVVSIIQESLQCDDITVKRAAAVFLNNLSIQDPMRRAIQEELDATITACLDSIDNDEEDEDDFNFLFNGQIRKHLEQACQS